MNSQRSTSLRVFLILFLLRASLLSAQQDSLLPFPSPLRDEEILENIEFQSEYSNTEDADYTELIENLEYYEKHPLNLNQCGREELRNLGLLNELQIEHLLDHIRRNGKLMSIYELQSIEGFDLFLIRRILPYVYVSDSDNTLPFHWSDLLTKSEQQLNLRAGQVLEQQKGFAPVDSATLLAKPNSRYLGSPADLFASYRYNFNNNLLLGFTGVKKPGEQFLRGGEKQGFDFNSEHLFFRGKRVLKALAIGDFSAGFGQGLISWSGIAFSKTADASAIHRSAAGLKPYTASNPNGFSRGLGTTLRKGPFELSAWGSYRKLDASLKDTNALGQPLSIRSINTSGLHATTTTLADKGKIIEGQDGLHLAYSRKAFQFGFTGLHTEFNAALQPRPEPYNLFTFRGRELNNAGMDYSFLVRNVYFFGESAISLKPGEALNASGQANLHGLVAALDPRLSFSVLFREYSRNYYSFNANAFSAGGKTNNEQGLYLGCLFKPVNTIQVSAYLDEVRFPWLKYRVNAPSEGLDYFIQINYKPNKKTEIYLHARHTERAQDPPANPAEEINYPIMMIRNNYRIQVSSSPAQGISFRSRVEWIVATDSLQSIEQGFLIAEDLVLSKAGVPIKLSLRYALFDTPSGNTRIYAFEHSLPGTFSIPSVSGRGSRCNVMLHYKVTPSLELWFSFARTFYDNSNVISKGTLNEIDTNHKTEVYVQTRLKF